MITESRPDVTAVRGLRAEKSAAGGGAVLIMRFLVTSVLNYGFGVALAWLLPRAQFGAVSVLQNVVLLAGAVCAAGLPWVVARAVARDEAGTASTLRAAFAGNLVLGLGLAAAFVVAQSRSTHVIPDPSILLTVAVAVTVVLLSVNSVITGALQGLRRFGAVGALHTAETAVKVSAGLGAAVLLGWGAGGVASGFVLGAIAVSLLGWWTLRDQMPGRGPFAFRPTLAAAVPTAVGTTSFALLGTIDVIVLGMAAQAAGVGTTTVAAYQAAAIIARAPYFVADSLADAIFPFVARGETWAQAHRWLAATYRWILLGLIPLQLVLLIAPGPVLAVLFPPAYADAAPLVQLITVGTLGLLTAVLLLKSLYARGQAAAVARCTPIAVLVELAGLTLVPKYGATAAAGAYTAGSWTCAILLALAYAHRYLPNLPAKRKTAGYLTALACLAAVLGVARHTSGVVAVTLIAVALLVYVAVVALVRLLRPDEVTRVRAVAARIRQRVAPAGTHVLAAAGSAALAAVAIGWNLARSPDTQYDEVVYTKAAQEVAQAGHLTWTNRPMFVHPPLSFLAQAGWLKALGRAAGPLSDAIVAARWLTGAVAVCSVALIVLVTARLVPAAGRRRTALLIAVVGVLAALDPVLLRYSRMAIIEPFALFAALLTLYLALALRGRRAALWIAVVGLGTGLALLTKEVTIFMLLTPALAALLGRDWRGFGRAVAAVTVGIVWWLLFPYWAVRLHLVGSFGEVKFATAERLVGLIQITGWNRPGASFASAVRTALTQYASTYLLLAAGALALLWLLLHRLGESARWVAAWLLTSYAFGAYSVLFGTLNEQFFVFVVPAAIVGTVLVADAILTARPAVTWRRVVLVPAVVVLGLVGSSTLSWAQFYPARNDGVFRATEYLRTRFPSCAAVNATGDTEKYAFLLPGRPVTFRASGPGALSQGIHLFLLSNKDAAERYGNASPELNDWVRAHGVRLAVFPSATYRGVEVWQVAGDPYDPLADSQSVADGLFVNTAGSRCGGFSVLNAPAGNFAAAWQRLGGKAAAGPPLTAAWPATSTPWSKSASAMQVFDGAILTANSGHFVTAAHVVPWVAYAAPAAYEKLHLPPVTGTMEPLDPAFAAWPGRGELGSVIGPATSMPDGWIRQAFAAGILEHQAGSRQVRLAPIGAIALDAGVVTPPAAARAPAAAPPLADDLPTPQPTDVRPFVVAFAALAAGYLVILTVIVLLGRRRRTGREPAAAVAPVEAA